MVVTLVLAIATASVFAVFGFPFRYYQYWLSWCGRSALGFIALYFLLSGGGGGALGWALAVVGRAQPTSVEALNGVLYGIAGALALRAGFGVRSRRTTVTAASADQLRSASSLLTAGIDWISGALDAIAQRRAERWLRGLDDEALVHEGYRISAQVQNVPSVVLTDRAKKQQLKQLVPLVETLTGTGSAEAARRDARAKLCNYAARHYLDQRFPRP